MDKISDYLSNGDLLCQLAQECSELAQAALKLKRAMEGTNPTQKGILECWDDLDEEIADTFLVIQQMGLTDREHTKKFVAIAVKKKERWLDRLQKNRRELMNRIREGKEFEKEVAETKRAVQELCFSRLSWICSMRGKPKRKTVESGQKYLEPMPMKVYTKKKEGTRMLLFRLDWLQNEIDRVYNEHYRGSKHQEVHDFYRAVARRIRRSFQGQRVYISPVITCKDCKHWNEEIEWCDIHSHFQGSDGEFCHPWESRDWKMFPPDYFCADGERGIRFKEDKK